MRLSAQGVGHRYRERVVLSGVELTVAGGELLAVAGPNGAGKSTLLRRLSGTLRGPGVVLIDGADLSRLPSRALAQRLTMLEQEVPADLAFRVEELVLLGRHPHRARLGPPSPRDRAAVHRAMEAMGILDLAPRPFSQLSGGERRKVLLAAVLAQEPQVLLLDEPTAHLDVHHQLEIMSLLSRLTGDGRAVLCALHDLNLAAAFAHRLLLLKDGRVVALGPPGEVLTRELLRDVFGVEAVVTRSPATGRPFAHFFIPTRAAAPNPWPETIHPGHLA
jgi:iron complex transport system ATP-binding protein